MNPDRLFDYLEGRLSPNERAALEEQLMANKELQRELAVARQIHAGMRGDSREVELPTQVEVSEQGRKMAARVGAAFMILVAVNVGIGLWFIFRHESQNPNRPLLEAQMREQIAKSIERAAATLTPGPNPFGVTDVTIPAEKGKLDATADNVVGIISRLGGSATKGVPDDGRLTILADVPANRELEFRSAVASIGGKMPELSAPGATTEPAESISAATAAASAKPGSSAPATVEKKSFAVQIVEPSSK